MATRHVLMLLSFLVACGRETPPPQPEPPAPAPAPAEVAAAPAEPLVPLRGIVLSAEQLTFRSCDGSPLRLVLDSVGTIRPIYTNLRATSEAGMFILGVGNLSRSGEAVIFRRLDMAALPAPTQGCEAPAPDYLVMARGTDLSWTLRIRDQGIEVTQSDSVSATPLRFPAAAPEDSSGMTRYQADAGGHSLHVLLSGGDCTLGNSGTYATMRAAVILDGRPLSGCAWRGAP